MGVAVTRILDRMMAYGGQLTKAEATFTAQLAVDQAGVLFALPALQTQGLLKATQVYEPLANGYYGLEHVVLLLSFMALLPHKESRTNQTMRTGRNRKDTWTGPGARGAMPEKKNQSDR